MHLRPLFRPLFATLIAVAATHAGAGTTLPSSATVTGGAAGQHAGTLPNGRPVGPGDPMAPEGVPPMYGDAREIALAPLFAKIEPLSESVGIIGLEIAGLPRDAAAGLGGEKAAAAIGVAYANVDEIDPGAADDGLLEALRAAVVLRRPILLESDDANRARVHGIGAALFGADVGPPRDSALMLAVWNGVHWEVRRTLGAIVASLGRAVPTPSIEPESKDVGGTYAMPYVRFAAAAYNSTAIVDGFTRYWQADDDIVSIFWRRQVEITPWGDVYNTDHCVVAWRGSVSRQDWIDNLANGTQGWATLSNPTFDAYKTSIVGYKYGQRFESVSSTLKTKLDALGCETLVLTGHSLGSAMAMYHAWRYSYTQATGLFKKLVQVRGYNGPGVGNSAWEDDYYSRVVNLTRITATNKCRYGDPVNGLPPGFDQTCSGAMGVRVSWTNPITNHNLTYWSQCKSSTSC